MAVILTRVSSFYFEPNMAVDGRIARLRIDISDEPGALAAITVSIGNVAAILWKYITSVCFMMFQPNCKD